MWIAAVGARSTGRNSYTGPFLVKLWQQGRTQIQLGIVESLNITRGTGNVGWSVDHLVMGIDLNITITNLSKMIHIPITTDTAISDTFSWFTQFDEDSNFTDYMAILGSVSLAEQMYVSDKWRLRRRASAQNFDTLLTPENLANNAFGFDTTTGKWISAFLTQKI